MDRPVLRLEVVDSATEFGKSSSKGSLMV